MTVHGWRYHATGATAFRLTERFSLSISEWYGRRVQFSVDAQTRDAAVNETVNFQEKTHSGLTVAWAGILAERQWWQYCERAKTLL